MPKPRKFVFLSDTHGDQADVGAVAAAKEFCRHFKPEVRIHGGDAFDLRCLRRGAGSEEVLEDLKADIDAGLDFLRWMRPTHYLRGNHCERLTDAINSHNPLLRRFACLTWEEVLHAIKGAQIFPYCKARGILQIGSLKFAHGFASGVYAAKRMAEVYGSVVFGHVHVSEAFSIPGLEPRVGRAAGCLCKLSMDYNRAQLNTLRQRHGFAYGFLHHDGTHEVYLASPINGVWRFPTEFREIRHAS
jgi:hypothetical protein